jgi:hypothetical protein
MFRALLAHPQEALHKRHLVHCVRVMSVGCTRDGVEVVLCERALTQNGVSDVTDYLPDLDVFKPTATVLLMMGTESTRNM